MVEGAGGQRLWGSGSLSGGEAGPAVWPLGHSVLGLTCQGTLAGWHGGMECQSPRPHLMQLLNSCFGQRIHPVSRPSPSPPLLPNVATYGAGDAWRPRGRVSAGSGWPPPGRGRTEHSTAGVAAHNVPVGPSLPGSQNVLWLAQPFFPVSPHVLHVSPDLHGPAQLLLQGPHPLGQRAPQTRRCLQARGDRCSPARPWGSHRCQRELSGPFPMLLTFPYVWGAAWEVISFQSPKCEPEQKPSCSHSLLDLSKAASLWATVCRGGMGTHVLTSTSPPSLSTFCPSLSSLELEFVYLAWAGKAGLPASCFLVSGEHAGID